MVSFRRLTSDREFIPQIDGLRFAAIFSVVLFHLHASLDHNGLIPSPVSRYALDFGMLSKRGVELFFLISGFILGMPFAKAHLLGGKTVHLGQYFLRRLTRLEPPYILNILICSAAVVLGGQQSLAAVRTHLLPTLLYLHQLIFRAPSIINGVTWSLEVEVQFYLLVPLLTAIFLMRRAWLRRGILAVAILGGSLCTIPLTNTFAQLSIAYYLPFFLAGLLVCDIYLAGGASWSRSFAWDIVGFIGWPLVWCFGIYWEHLVLPFVAAILFISVFRGRLSSYLFSIPLITNIGGMCYSIYLFHFVGISAVGKITKRLYLGGGFGGYFFLQAVLILPVVLCFCVIYYLAIERPCMDKNWPSKLAGWVRAKPLKDCLEVGERVIGGY
jgi:peptidoglycan/LPS O-acetylase OafA/YrhL